MHEAHHNPLHQVSQSPPHCMQTSKLRLGKGWQDEDLGSSHCLLGTLLSPPESTLPLVSFLSPLCPFEVPSEHHFSLASVLSPSRRHFSITRSTQSQQSNFSRPGPVAINTIRAAWAGANDLLDFQENWHLLGGSFLLPYPANETHERKERGGGGDLQDTRG